MIQSYHKAALAAMREFWRLLLYDAVNMNSLTSAFRKIEMMERLADRTYKVVLERYPKVGVLAGYGNSRNPPCFVTTNLNAAMIFKHEENSQGLLPCMAVAVAMHLCHQLFACSIAPRPMLAADAAS